MRARKALFINLGVILLVYLGFGLLVSAAEGTTSILIKMGVVPLIAGLQNHLQILQHEGAHYHIFPQHRRINDFITDVFCALPFLGLTQHYRYFHFLHHRHLLNPELDPEIEFYRQQGYEFKTLTRKQRRVLFIKDLCGYHFLQFSISFWNYLLKEGKKISILRLSRTQVLSITLVLLILTLCRWETILIYWFLPQATFLFCFMKIHGLKEHSARSHTVESCTFDRKINIFERFFISPLNSHLHLSHHKRPGIPWFNNLYS